MMNTYSIRLYATPEQFKELRKLAVERELTMVELVTTAVQTSPITKRVFK